MDEIQIHQAITGNIDIRRKIQILKALALIRNPAPDWLHLTIAILDKIDNDLRVRRNNFIHAGWYNPKGILHKITKKTKLIKTQSFQQALETEQKIPVKIAELRKLKKELWSSSVDLYFIMWFATRSTSPDDPSLPQISFSQYLHLTGYGIRRIRAHLKHERQR